MDDEFMADGASWHTSYRKYLNIGEKETRVTFTVEKY